MKIASLKKSPLKKSPTKQSKENSPAKLIKSPTKSDLQPFLIDRTSPQKALKVFVAEPEDTSMRLEPCASAKTLLEFRKETKSSPGLLSEIIELDSKILTFGKFTSGRVLGSTLTVRNRTDKVQTITLQIVSEYPKN